MKAVGFLGVGLMGSGMVRTLARRGYAVTAYNRTSRRIVELEGDGIRAAATPIDAIRSADVVISMLSEVDVLASLLAADGALASLRPGTHLIDSSTSGPSASQALAGRLREAGVIMLDAPVFGSKDSAAAGELTFVVGGPRDAFEACSPLFAAMGQHAFHVGDNGAGCLAKLGFNLVIAGTLQAFAETLVLTTAGGVNPRQMFEIVMAGRARSGIIEMKAPRMLARDFTPFFPLKHMAKDLRLMIEAARELGVELPMTEVVRATYENAVASGLGERDFCSVIASLEPPAATSADA